MVGLRKSSIYEKVKTGEFPSPVKLSRRAVCWPASSVDAWIADRIKGSSK
jgi:prophage regulatory protein